MKRKAMIAIMLLVMILSAVLPALAGVDAAPKAENDVLAALKNQTVPFGAGKLFEDNGSGPDDRGTPEATIASFGVATATEKLVGESTSFAGGVLTVNADGSLNIANPTLTGPYSFFYRLENADGFSDAWVEVNISEAPDAKRDDFTFAFNVNQTVPPNTDLFKDNGYGADLLGVPAATLVSFGGQSAGGDPDSYIAGSTVPFAGGSLKISANGRWGLLGAPFNPGRHSVDYTISNIGGTSIGRAYFFIQAPPVAVNDELGVFLNQDNIFDEETLFSDNGSGEDDLGYPEAQIIKFGGGSLSASVTDYDAGDTAPFGSAGGTVSVKANGGFVMSLPTTPGTYTLLYRLQNSSGTSDASITIAVTALPVAERDDYSFPKANNQLVDQANGLFADNGHGTDDRGVPLANLFSYGDGALGGAVTDNLAGAPVSIAGGTMIVNTNGSWSLSGAPFEDGIYSFAYRLKNTGGVSDERVYLEIRGEPTAQDDALLATQGKNLNLPPGKLFADNGSGADDRATPAALIASFGGGSLPGDATTNAAGTAVDFAGGNLMVNADGSLNLIPSGTPDTYTFDYRLSNSEGFSDATVTLVIRELPTAKDDAYIFLVNADQNFAAADGLFADNGSGADILGDPPAVLTRFGGGSLGGTPVDHAAGTVVALAGGKLKVNGDGSWSLTEAPFVSGNYSFSYIIDNTIDKSTAEVSLTINANPDAQNDDLEANVLSKTDFIAGTLFNDNGSGVDERGFPVADLVSFGGGSAGGTVTSNTAGDTVAFAGGTLKVNADGSLTLDTPTETGIRSFQYRISNALGSSDASVFIQISQRPKNNFSYSPVIFIIKPKK